MTNIPENFPRRDIPVSQKMNPRERQVTLKTMTSQESGAEGALVIKCQDLLAVFLRQSETQVQMT